MRHAIEYGLAVIVWLIAIPVSSKWSAYLHKKAAEIPPESGDTPDPPKRIEWFPAWIGIFERTIIAILVGWNVSGAGAFVGTWVLVKSAGGWQQWSRGTTRGRAVLIAGLLGSAMSVLFALVSGLIVGTTR